MAYTLVAYIVVAYIVMALMLPARVCVCMCSCTSVRALACAYACPLTPVPCVHARDLRTPACCVPALFAAVVVSRTCCPVQDFAKAGGTLLGICLGAQVLPPSRS